MSQLQSRRRGKPSFPLEHGDFVPYELAAQKGSCDQPQPDKGYIDGRAQEHTLGCFSSSRLYNQEVKRRLGAGQCHLRVLTINIGEESV